MKAERKDREGQLAVMKARLANLERQVRDGKARDQKRIKELLGQFVLARGIDLRAVEFSGIRFADWVSSEADKRILARFLERAN